MNYLLVQASQGQAYPNDDFQGLNVLQIAQAIFSQSTYDPNGNDQYVLIAEYPILESGQVRYFSTAELTGGQTQACAAVKPPETKVTLTVNTQVTVNGEQV